MIQIHDMYDIAETLGDDLKLAPKKRNVKQKECRE